MKNRESRALCVIALLMMCSGLAAAQRPSPAPAAPQKATVEITGRVLDERGKLAEDSKLEILITDEDCSCLLDPECEDKPCRKCCRRARIVRANVENGILSSKTTEIPLGMRYRVIITDKDGRPIYQSPVREATVGKQDIKLPVLQPFAIPAIQKDK